MLFGVATVLGVSSTLQAYRLELLNGKGWSAFSQLLTINLFYWWVPAALVPIVFRLSARWPLDTSRPVKPIAIHVVASLVYSVLHTAFLTGVRLVVVSKEAASLLTWTSLQRMYLSQLDWLLVTYWGAVGVAHALTYRRESETRHLAQAQLETRLVEARLDALRHQLRPHFLFNTLNTISGLMHIDLRAADQTIDHLGTLLRVTLASDQQEQSLRDELAALEPYVAIEHIRFGDRLRVKMDIDPETLDVRVPTLVLQPLVENAIRHGIAPLPEGGEITISARADAGTLTLQVVDTGRGLRPRASFGASGGVGLTNTRARLEHLYGSQSSLVLSGRDRGCNVTITLPVRGGRPARPHPARDAVAV